MSTTDTQLKFRISHRLKRYEDFPESTVSLVITV